MTDVADGLLTDAADGLLTDVADGLLTDVRWFTDRYCRRLPMVSKVLSECS